MWRAVCYNYSFSSKELRIATNRHTSHNPVHADWVVGSEMAISASFWQAHGEFRQATWVGSGRIPRFLPPRPAPGGRFRCDGAPRTPCEKGVAKKFTFYASFMGKNAPKRAKVAAEVSGRTKLATAKWLLSSSSLIKRVFRPVLLFFKILLWFYSRGSSTGRIDWGIRVLKVRGFCSDCIVSATAACGGCFWGWRGENVNF